MFCSLLFLLLLFFLLFSSISFVSFLFRRCQFIIEKQEIVSAKSHSITSTFDFFATMYMFTFISFILYWFISVRWAKHRHVIYPSSSAYLRTRLFTTNTNTISKIWSEICRRQWSWYNRYNEIGTTTISFDINRKSI